MYADEVVSVTVSHVTVSVFPSGAVITHLKLWKRMLLVTRAPSGILSSQTTKRHC